MTQEIIVGPPRTGKTTFICHSQTSYSRGRFDQCGHAHACLFPDSRPLGGVQLGQHRPAANLRRLSASQTPR